jgi:outer membrane protein OmpA-like peptidoglycan-associated protein
MTYFMRCLDYCALLFCLILLPATSSAQSSLGKIKKTADQYFETGDYRQALNHYVRYDQYKSGLPHIVKRMAICQFYNNQVDKAYDNLVGLISSGQAAKDKEIYFYFAEALMHQNQLKQAAQVYKQYLRKLKSNDTGRAEIIHKIKNCESGIDIINSPQVGFIENLGPVVNSIEDDICPLFSRNHQDRIYYASNFNRDEANPLNAKKSFDIYSTELQSGDWADPALFPKKFSSARDEWPMAFLNEGQVMYFQRGSSPDASILIDTFSSLDDQEFISEFTASTAPIFPELGDQNFHNYGDTLILFSSARPGGYGGFDLYYTLKNRQGWSAPKNLGSRVNTSYDELDPFLTNNAATLYFSSNRSASMGGFDVFQSRFNSLTRDWGAVKNVGRPINSVGNDRYLQIAENGSSYIISSDRKTGYGGYDLYIVYAESPLGDMNTSRGIIRPAFLERVNIPPRVSEDISIDDATITEPTIDEIIAVEDLSPPIIDNSIYPMTKMDVSSIYYSENDVVLNPQSSKELEKVAAILKKYPNLELQLFSHSASYDGPIYFDLYFSARRAEQVINFLHEKGVDKNNMSICGVGSQFPYARTIINGEIAGFSTKLNRRIDLVIHNGVSYNLSFNYSDGGLGDEWVDDKHKLLKRLMNGVSFKVEVKKASQVFKDDVLDEHDFPLIEKLTNKNIYHYTVGWSTSWNDMKNLREQLITKGYEDARIIAYYQGSRLDNETAERLAKKNSELKRFINN